MCRCEKSSRDCATAARTCRCLLRFRDLLHSRIEELNESFAKAIGELGYKGKYRGVYPIKVNQQQQVIEEIAAFGRKYHYGLEAGARRS